MKKYNPCKFLKPAHGVKDMASCLNQIYWDYLSKHPFLKEECFNHEDKLEHIYNITGSFEFDKDGN